jgi:hypothetical protein
MVDRVEMIKNLENGRCPTDGCIQENGIQTILSMIDGDGFVGFVCPVCKKEWRFIMSANNKEGWKEKI